MVNSILKGGKFMKKKKNMFNFPIFERKIKISTVGKKIVKWSNIHPKIFVYRQHFLPFL